MFFNKAIFIFITAYSASLFRKPEIIHIGFCDVINATPRLQDGQLADSSFRYTSIIYLVNETNPKYFADSVLKDFIKSDSFIQDEIRKNYNELTVHFYQKSENTDALMKTRTSKYLSDCNDDEIAEFDWENGKFDIVWHFKNGRMLEAENIVLEDISSHHSSVSGNREKEFTRKMELSSANIDTTGDAKAAFIYYEKRSDTLFQNLSIRYISGSGIRFDLQSVNKRTRQETKLSGDAYAKPGQDPEYDEDEEGNAYAATVYHYKKGNCNLSIRIGLDHHDKALIMEYSCNKLHPTACPFGTVGLLRRVSL